MEDVIQRNTENASAAGAEGRKSGAGPRVAVCQTPEGHEPGARPSSGAAKSSNPSLSNNSEPSEALNVNPGATEAQREQLQGRLSLHTSLPQPTAGALPVRPLCASVSPWLNPSSPSLTEPAAFSLSLARRLAWWARAAYGEAEVSEPRTDTQVLVRDCGEFIVVAFRGTSSLRDFITDGEACRAKAAFGCVHYGFLKCHTAVSEMLGAHIVSLPPKPLLVTGHSLGGALAILFTSRWESEKYPILATYTFGCPRVGDAKFCDWYNALHGARTFCVVNAEDIVPRLPGVLLGYRRVRNQILLTGLTGLTGFLSGRAASFKINPSWWFWLVADALGLYRVWRMKQEVLLGDHHIDHYLETLLKAEGTV